MSALGGANGGVAQWSGYILFTNPPSYQFYPASPSVAYSNVGALFSSISNILFGWGDYWATNYNQWAAARKDNLMAVYRATPPPQIEIVKELRTSSFDLLIARWDGEYRLWARSTDGRDRNLIVPLGKDVRIVAANKASLQTDKYDKITPSALFTEGFEIVLSTDIYNLHKKTNTWRLVVAQDQRGALSVAFGDTAWDGDKIGYMLHFLPPP
ncbi:MAG: hypothetical protein ACP5MH_12110 [Thermoproteus sp.]